MLAALSHFLNLTAALASVFAVLFVLPRFAQIFQDMLGGQPLPPLTDFVLRFQVLWLGCGLVLVGAAIYSAWRYRLRFAPPMVSAGLFLLAVALVGLITFAMYLPLVGTIVRQRPPPQEQPR